MLGRDDQSTDNQIYYLTKKPLQSFTISYWFYIDKGHTLSYSIYHSRSSQFAMTGIASCSEDFILIGKHFEVLYAVSYGLTPWTEAR